MRHRHWGPATVLGALPGSIAWRAVACITLITCIGVAGPSAFAQATAKLPPPTGSATDGPRWESLTAAQKQALAPLAADWAGIDASRKAKWLEVAAKFPGMPAEERQRVQERMAEWARMSPNDRARARLNFQEAKQLTPQEKQAQWDAYQALSDEERKALAERARQKAEAARVKPAVPPAPIDQSIPKQNVVARSAASAPLVKPVTPTVVQAKPGATTTPMTKAPSPPAFQQPGQPKIAAKPSQVDGSTLLPKREVPKPAPAAASAASKP